MRKKVSSAWVARIKRYSKKWYVQWGVALVIFSACTGVYMGKSITQCSEIYYGSPSDATGGIAWFQWADGNDPTWDSTTKSNFPVGESLKRPQFVTSYLQFFPYWLFSVLTNQFCAINIMVFLGFLSTALAMFGLVRWLTRSYAVSVFAGFAAAFVPYHVLKAGSHIAYNYSIFFILMIWACLGFYRQPSYKLAVAIAAIFGLSFYFDGYFILISSVLLAVLVAAILIRYLFTSSFKNNRFSLVLTFDIFKRYIVTHAKYYFISFLTLGLVLAPLAYVALTRGGEIQSGLNSARSDIKAEANIYGARIEDYLLPSPIHPLLHGEYSEWRTKNIHNSNIGENTLYIGYVVILLALFAVVSSLTWKRKEAKKFRFAIATTVAIIVVGSLISAPPVLRVGGIDIQMPSSLLISVSESWRVLSRLFLAVHTAWVILAAIGLYLLLKVKSDKIRLIIFSIVAIILVFEFLPNPYPPSWTANRDVPKVYFRIKEDDSIKALAEYPIIDNPSATLPFTFTFQQFHEKPILNANDTNTPQRYIRQAINGIRDDQTLPVLRAFGIDLVTTYDIDASSVPGLKPYTKPDSSSHDLVGTIYSFRVLPGEKAKAVLVPIDGFKFYLNEDKTKNTMAMKNVSLMRIDPMPGVQLPETVTASVDLAPAVDATTTVWIEQDGKKLWEGEIRDQKRVVFRAKTGSLIKIVSPGHDVDDVVYVRNPKVIND